MSTAFWSSFVRGYGLTGTMAVGFLIGMRKEKCDHLPTPAALKPWTTPESPRSEDTITPELYVATSPAGLRASFTRFVCTSTGCIKMGSIAMACAALGIVLVWKVAWWVGILPLGVAALLGAAAISVFRDISQCYRDGDLVAAVVVNRSPLQYIAITDLRKRMDILPITGVILRGDFCPSFLAPKVGTRIGCAAFYDGGTDMDDAWQGFCPLPLRQATWSRREVAKREEKIDVRDWELLELVIAEGLAPATPAKEAVHLERELVESVKGPLVV